MEEIEEFYEKDTNYYFKKGINFEIKKDYNKAIGNYSKAIELDPNNVNAYLNRGLIYEKLKKYDKSLEDLNKAIELDPNNANSYLNLGLIYERMCSYTEALKYLEKSIKLNPNNEKAYLMKASIYIKQREYEAAIKEYDKAIKINPTNSTTYFNRGLIYGALNNTKQAIEEYSKAIKLNPNDTSSYYNRSIHYEVLKNYEAALKDMKIISDLKPNHKVYSERYKNLEKKYKENQEQLEAQKTEELAMKIKEYLKKDIAESIYKIQPSIEKVSEKKFLTFADILGWKGIWQRDKSINSKKSNINKMKNIKSQLFSFKENYLEKNKNIDGNINLISDTFIIASNDIKLHNSLCKKLISLCLENGLLIRGATAYGEYLSEDMIYIGEAVDEAASWHESAEEVAIFYTISARLKLEEIVYKKTEKERKDYLKEIELINSEVQLKKGKMDTYLISWIDDEKNRIKFKEIMKKEIIYPELALKYLNTEKQINNFLKNNQ
ncbi:tetratricopeptide repeat protein [Fusobacterium sp. HC1336]|uniref:tetratricopeptide repeat protein n=1 Tax=Fusobacterium sp. HC1336 TaxID=3171169 RepID=UPI003F2891AD